MFKPGHFAGTGAEGEDQVGLLGAMLMTDAGLLRVKRGIRRGFWKLCNG